MTPRIAILGTRGIPAQHGGYETFAEYLAPYLVSRGWQVTVYCQEEGAGAQWEDDWQGVRLVHIPVRGASALATAVFDWRSVWHVVGERCPGLTLGYNTGCFGAVLRTHGLPNLINMDGMEWKRQKWSWFHRAWFYVNEWLGAWFAHQAIADHPEMARHLRRRIPSRKITMIPYGADLVTDADPSLIASLGLQPGGYALVIARPEPENSILEIVTAFCARTRGTKLVVLGQFDREANTYHRRVLEAAGDEVVFPGALYERAVVQSLRYHCALYVHGHTVGGTNPSLVEALGAGSPVLAHDNEFNRWVAGSGARYFRSTGDCVRELDILLNDASLLATMRESSYDRFHQEFTWDKVLGEYEELLGTWARGGISAA